MVDAAANRLCACASVGMKRPIRDVELLRREARDSLHGATASSAMRTITVSGSASAGSRPLSRMVQHGAVGRGVGRSGEPDALRLVRCRARDLELRPGLCLRRRG
jgi:hypothetical protein